METVRNTVAGDGLAVPAATVKDQQQRPVTNYILLAQSRSRVCMYVRTLPHERHHYYTLRAARPLAKVQISRQIKSFSAIFWLEFLPRSPGNPLCRVSAASSDPFLSSSLLFCLSPSFRRRDVPQNASAHVRDPTHSGVLHVCCQLKPENTRKRLTTRESHTH